MRRFTSLVLLAGALFAGAALTACGDDDSPPPLRDGGYDGATGCVAGRIRCGTICVDPNTDPFNCGRCAAECPASQTCSAGACRMAMECPVAGEIDCGGTCVDAQTSDLHCGRCGNACDVTQTCIGGSCVLRDCPSGQMRCGTACVDLVSDEANCGTCGTRCAAAQECRASRCESRCATGEVSCELDGMARCADFDTDSENCGECGNVCRGGRECVAGACECPMGTTVCGRSCVDLQTDSANCGACADRCASGIACVAGSCECAGGLTLCGLSCRNTRVDDDHCGMCGNRCATGTTCVAGRCESSCAAGMTMCGASCVDLREDPMNCGACGTRCAAGEGCSAGLCRPSNDDFADAIALTLGTAEVTVMGTTAGATRDGPAVPCICTSAGNVWYSFTLAAESIVYFDTAGSAFDTSLFLTNSMGTPVAGQMENGFPEEGLCNDDARCAASGGTGWSSTLQSWTAGRLPAGTYYLSVGGCGTGAFTLHAQRMAQNASYWYTTRLNGSGTTSTILVGASTLAGTCEVARGTTSGEDMRWFITCGDRPQLFSLCPSDGGSWEYRDGGTTYDPVMYVHSASTGAEVACNDDGAGTGSDCSGTGGTGTSPGWGSRLSGLTVPRGLNAVFVDSATGGPGMNYTLRYDTR